jgi:prolyl oligopeptidase PreP (S9A serine peptidase family)
MTLPIAIVMGTTLVLCVVGWKLGDVFRDWMALRRLDVETRLVRVENVATLAAEDASKAMRWMDEQSTNINIVASEATRTALTVKAHAEELERLRIRTSRGL